MRKFIKVFILFVMAMASSVTVSAKLYMGKITLTVGEATSVSAVPATSGYTASGSFSKTGTSFTITANGSYYCTIRANYVGTGTLSYWGSVARSGSWTTDIYDMYWDVEVKASPTPISSITINETPVTLAVGDTKQLSVTVSPTTATDKSVSWSSSAPDVVSVSDAGLLTANANGTATITCTAKDGSGVSATCEVNVVDKVPVTEIVLDTPENNLGIGDKRSIYYTIIPDNATNKEVTWESSDPDVVAIVGNSFVRDADGTIIQEGKTLQGKAIGSATISCTATDGSGVKATWTVNVYRHGDKSSFKAKTAEGIEMSFYVEDGSSGECMVNQWCIDRETTGTITIPSEVDGLKVTGIKDDAFYNCKNITKVDIPSSVKVIGGCAFIFCSSLSDVSLGGTEEIGRQAFYNCTALTSIKLNGVKRLGNSVFYGCTSLSSVTGVAQLEYIGYYAFGHYQSDFAPWYSKLPDGLIYLGKVLYKYKGTMPANTVLVVKEGILSISPFAIDQSGLISISIPKSLTYMDYSSFEGSNLKKITVDASNETYDSREDCNAVIETATNTLLIGCKGSTVPNSIDSIADNAFYYRGSLDSIRIGSGVQKIGTKAFYGSNLSSISVAEDNPYFDSRENCNAVIETVTNRIVLGSKATIIPTSVKSIGSNAFSYADGLESISIHDGVESIEALAFYGLFSLKYLTLGRGLKAIGEQAFYNCSNLKSIHSLADAPVEFSKDVFRINWYQKEDSIYNTAKLYVPIGAQMAYLTTEGWVYFKNVAEIDDNTLVDGEVFADETVEGIELKYQVTDAIAKTCELKSSPETITGFVTIPEKPKGYTVTAIGQDVFGKRSITGVSIPSSVKSIGNSAFYYCGLSEIKLPEALDSIASWAFYGNSSLETVMIGKGLRKIMSSAFGYCQKLKSITVASANPYFDSRDNCNAIIETSTNKLLLGCPTTVIPASVKTIGENAFYNYGNSDLYTMTIPDNVEKIEDYAVEYNYNLRSLTLGKNVKEIGKSVFYGCNALRSIRSLATSPAEIDEIVFKSNYTYYPDTVYNNATLYVPVGSKINYMTSTGWNKFKKIVELSDMSEPQEGDIIEADGPLLYAVNNVQNHTCEVVGVKSNVQGDIDIPSQFKGYDVTAIGTDAFYNKKGITKVSIPASITELKEYAFYNCSDLESINLPSSLECIGYFALGGLGKVTQVEIPRSVTYIDRGILTADSLLTSITVEEGNSVYDSRGGCNAIIETATNKLVAGCQATVIPNEIKVIGAYAFNSQKKLKTIRIPDNVTCIEQMAFNNSGIQSITIPAHIDIIGQEAFRYCRQLTAVTSLISQPFAINENVFHTDYVDGKYLFTNATLYVPIGTKALYEATEGWSKFQNIVEIETPTEPSVKGDVNGDEEINGTDLVALSNIVLGRKEKTESADVNGDGSVNGTDIVALSNIILGRGAYVPRRAGEAGTGLSIEPFDIQAGEEKEMLIDLTNPNDELTLVQFDLHLPEGLSIKKNGADLDIDMGDRTTWRKHTLDANETDGGYRFLLYSSSNTVIDGTSGAIIKVKLVADAPFKGGKIVIDNTLLVTPNETEIKPETYEYTFPTVDDGSAKLAIEPFDIKAGEEKEMLIDLTNPNDEITLVQFDLQLPEGLTVKKSGADLVYDMGDRTSWRKHTLDANETDGGYRFLLYSSGNTVIDGTSGAIIKVTLVASQDMTGKTIALDNILLVSPDEKETKPARYEYVIGTDGIRTITIDNEAYAPIYNLRGHRLTAPQKGINIIGGKKVVVK